MPLSPLPSSSYPLPLAIFFRLVSPAERKFFSAGETRLRAKKNPAALAGYPIPILMITIAPYLLRTVGGLELFFHITF